MPMERKTPVAYPDGVYEIAGFDRPNVLVIANLSQNGLTGRGSSMRTGFFIFFGEFGSLHQSRTNAQQEYPTAAGARPMVAACINNKLNSWLVKLSVC